MGTVIAPCGFIFMLFMIRSSALNESGNSRLSLPQSHQIHDRLSHDNDKPFGQTVNVFSNACDGGDYKTVSRETNRKNIVKSSKNEISNPNTISNGIDNLLYARDDNREVVSQNKRQVNNHKNKKLQIIIDQLKLLKTRRKVAKLQTKLKVKTQEFITDNFPTSYAQMDLSHQEDVQLKDKLDFIENMVNQAAYAKSILPLNDALVLIQGLLSGNGVGSPRAFVQYADALSLLYYLNNFDDNIIEHAIDTYNNVLTLFTDIEMMYKVATKRFVNVLRALKRHTHAISIQKALISRFPNNASEDLNILGTINMELGNSKEAIIVFNRSLQLKSEGNGFAKMHLGYLQILNLEEKFSVMGGQDVINDSWKHLLEPFINMMQTGIQNVQQSGEGSYIAPYIPYVLGNSLRKIGQIIESEEIFEMAVKRKKFNSFWQRTAFHVENVKSKPFWKLKETKIGNLLKRIRKKWKVIRKEGLEALKSNKYINESESQIRDTGEWKQFPVYNVGKRIDQNCLYAPVTCNFIQEIPQISENRQGIVKFSLMTSGTHVHTHSGPSNCRLRAHLGLDVPKGNENMSAVPAFSSRLRVLNEYRSWNDGELLVFDDSFDHEVWHFDPQNRSRLILIIDMWHPSLSEAQIASN